MHSTYQLSVEMFIDLIKAVVLVKIDIHSVNFGGQSTSGVNRLIGVERIFRGSNDLGVKRPVTVLFDTQFTHEQQI